MVGFEHSPPHCRESRTADLLQIIIGGRLWQTAETKAQLRQELCTWALLHDLYSHFEAQELNRLKPGSLPITFGSVRLTGKEIASDCVDPDPPNFSSRYFEVPHCDSTSASPSTCCRLGKY